MILDKSKQRENLQFLVPAHVWAQVVHFVSSQPQIRGEEKKKRNPFFDDLRSGKIFSSNALLSSNAVLLFLLKTNKN